MIRKGYRYPENATNAQIASAIRNGIQTTNRADILAVHRPLDCLFDSRTIKSTI